MLRKLLMMAVGLLVAVGVLRAATINVGPGQPFTTIQSGINAANNGDTVLVAPGTYYENIDFKGKAITVTSAAGAGTTIIDGGGIAATVAFRSGELRSSTLSNLTIRGGAILGGIYIQNSAPTIQNNIITANSCFGVFVSDGDALIQSNEISLTSSPALGFCNFPSGAIDPGVGVMLYGSAPLGTLTFNSVIGNTIENNPSGTLTGSTIAGGIYTYETTDTLIQSNIIRNNKGSLGGAFVSSSTYRFSFFQNLVYGNVGEFLAYGGEAAAAGGLSILASPSPSTFTDSVGPYVGIIAGNTITGNTYSEVTHNQLPNEEASDVAIEGNVGQIIFVNNIVSASTTLPAVLCGAFFNNSAYVPLMIDHNDVYNSNAQGSAYGGVCANTTAFYGNISQDPQFISPSSSNYQLLPTSPAIDAGNNSAFLLNLDIAGATRVQNASGKLSSEVDIGAYESSGSSSGISAVVTAVPSTYFDPGKTYTSAKELFTVGQVITPAGSSSQLAELFEDARPAQSVLIPQAGSATFTYTPPAGLHEYVAVTSSQSGLPSTPSVPFYLIVPKTVTTQTLTAMTLASSLNPSNVGESVTFTVVVTTAQSGYGTPTGTVSFSYGLGTLATVTLDSSGAASFTTATLPRGIDQITAVYQPTGNYSGTAAILNQAVNGPEQTVTFSQPASPAYVATSVALNATASSGQPVTYKVVSGPANVSGSTLTYSGAGKVVVEADQAGTNGYQAASAQVTVNAVLLTEPVGTVSSSVTTLVTIANAGTLGSVGAFTQGAANADFTVLPGGSCTVGTTYTAGQTCTLNFSFDPTRPGQRYGGLLLADGAGNTLASSHVYGVGVGPQVGFLPGTQGLLGSGLNKPSGVAVDGNGNTFVSEYGGGLAEITATGVQSSLGSFGVTSDVAVDGSGDVIVTDEHNVYEILAVNGSLPASPTVLTLGTGFKLINGVAVDATGNVFVATGTGNATIVNGVTTYDGALYELQAVNGVIPQPSTAVSLGSGFGQLTGVAVDASNNVYVSDGQQKAVFELMAVNGIIPASPVMRSLGGGFTDPSNVRLDAANDVYLTDAGAAAVYEILAVNGSVPSTNATVRTLGKGFSSPQGMVIDAKGNVFFADFGQADVVTLNYSNPPTLNFATTPVGSTSVDSPQTATLFNNGNAPLTLAVPSSGNNASISQGFTIGSGSTCPLVTNTTSPAPTLAAGGYCTELVSFTPVAPGVDSGKLIETDNALNAPGAMQTVLLNGTGLVQTTTAISSSLNPAGVGASVMFTATVSSSVGTPTGTVVFSDGTTQIGTGTLTNGSATFSTSALTMGTHTITASYAATGEFGASSASLSQVIGYQSVTTTAVTPEPSTYGQTVTFTVHVAGAAGSTGTPSGTVTLNFCHGAIVGITLDANGNGSSVQPPPGGHGVSNPAGTCLYTANYLGDAYFFPSASAATPFIVNPGPSTTTVIGAPNPGFAGQAVILTATVAGNPSPTLGPGGVVLPPGATVATGTVQFFDGTVSLGTATLGGAQNGVQTASLATSALAVGTHSITAVYSGDANLNGSTSASFVETIELAPTATTLTASPNPSEQNHAVILSVSVTALLGVAAPAGSVAIFDGGVLLTTLNALSPSGLTSAASFAASGLAPGTHLLQAIFTPPAGFGPSQSSVVSLVILPQDFTLTANPPTMTVETEHHATMTLQLASLGGFAANIALSCNGPVPQWVTCYLPSQVALAADATTPVSFTIDTDAVKFFKSEVEPPATPRGRGLIVFAGLLPLAMLGFARRRRRLLHLLVVAALTAAAVSMTACSGYYPAHTEPGTYTVTVTAVGTTAGATAPTTHTLDVTLTVTP